MIVVSTETITGKNLQPLAVAQGNVVWSKHIGRDIMAGFKTIIGGEIVSYTEMLAEAREIAFKRMIESAEKMRADAIVCVRFATSSIMNNASELVAYGTAVKFI